jgi:ATP-binding cassette, subfamily B, bacterial MsbA
MKKFYKIFKFIIPFKWQAAASIFYNILAAFFSLFSLTMIIPFLDLLFGNVPLMEARPEFAMTITAVKDILYYYLSYLIITQGNSFALMFVILLVIVTSLFKNFFTYIALWYIAPIRIGVVRDIRNALFAKVLELPLGFYTEEKKGDIISKMTNDVNEIEVSIIRSLEMFFKEPIIIIVHLSALIIMSPELTVFVIIMLPIAGGFIGRVGKSLRKTSFRGQKKMGALLSIIEETLGGIRIIKAFNAEPKMSQRFHSVNSFYTRLMTKMWRRRDLAKPLSEVLGTIVIVTVLWYGSKLVFDEAKNFSAQELIGYIAIFYMIINPAKSFSSAYFNVLKGMASADRIDGLLFANNPIKDTDGATEIKDFESKIEYQNVCFKYKNDYVLKNINVTIEKGKTVALVGQSGSGKSTFVDLLPRFYDVFEGEILIDGINIKKYKLKNLRNLMGNVNQEPILFNDTFYNNIAFGLENTTEEEVIAAAKIANAHEFIISSPNGYYSNIGDRGSKLSGGQRQRLSIARAILKNPPIMILDEATSALDTESERLVQDAIENLMKNRTSIVIAHRLSTVKNADLICVLHEGEIVERGKHDELLALGGIYSKLYSMQQ